MTTEVHATDTFSHPARRQFFIAGEEVSENVYRRHEEAWAEVKRLRGVVQVHDQRQRDLLSRLKWDMDAARAGQPLPDASTG